MPLVSQSVMGAKTVTPAMVNRSFSITLGGGGSFLSEPLDVNQMPNLRLYIRQTVGAAPGTVTLQMAVRGDALGGGLNFLPLASGTVLPPLNVPLILEYSFPCAFIRVEIAGANADEYELVYGAYGP